MNRRNFLRSLATSLALAMIPLVRERPWTGRVFSVSYPVCPTTEERKQIWDYIQTFIPNDYYISEP